MFASVPAVPRRWCCCPSRPSGSRRKRRRRSVRRSGALWQPAGARQFPKLAGLLDVALRRGGLAAYGGGCASSPRRAVEITFSLQLGAISALATTRFLIGLAFGRAAVGWNGQVRDAHALSFSAAVRGLWGQTLSGFWWARRSPSLLRCCCSGRCPAGGLLAGGAVCCAHRRAVLRAEARGGGAVCHTGGGGAAGHPCAAGARAETSLERAA